MKKMELHIQLIKDKVSVCVTKGEEQFDYTQRVGHFPIDKDLGIKLLLVIDTVFELLTSKK